MIFALVFWDIIFAPIPGAFETAFQTAPLDIATDAFEIARRPMIEERMRKDLLEIVACFSIKRDVSSSKLKDQVISYQSNKKYNWFSLLLKAKGIEVEICSVKEE
ncbi:hypothetical protein Pst134EB_006363 [Puccinia striiformis f. sp. tritici]|nr:hypothetical protein Pst134EB_006363 [Puccinia striiformis f. sp. tritici]